MTEKHYSPAYLAYMDLHKPTESGRYAEAGYNDHFNDGLDALWDALEDAGIVRELALDSRPWAGPRGYRYSYAHPDVGPEWAPREGYEQDRSKYA